MKCIVEQKQTEDLTNEYNPQTRYYQWVTFIFAIQVMFLSAEAHL